MMMLLGMLFVGGVSGFDLVTNVQTNESVNTVTNVYNSSDVAVWINGVQWSNVPEYIASNEARWGIDTQGLSEYSFSRMLQRFVKYQKGENIQLTNKEEEMFYYLSYLNYLQIKEQLDYFHEYVDKVSDSVAENKYMTEAMRGLLEREFSEELCNEKKKVMHKYNLKSVKCGDSVCYNGEVVELYKGKDVCVVQGNVIKQEIKENVALNNQSFSSKETVGLVERGNKELLFGLWLMGVGMLIVLVVIALSMWNNRRDK